MKYTYILRIDCGNHKIKIVNDILGVDTTSNSNNSYWEQTLIEEALDPPVNFVDDFLNILEGKYQKLSIIGVNKDDITVWMYYEYDEQCNMSFSPEVMKRLGDNEITLCISCWEANSKNISQ
ncbi:MAG: hypothetical protein RMY64_31260 [Nostoc sp. DedQUE08]|uniref:hypothetical protein n=1 Tax=Nostoc sp. DedQUE08 TaxID=3075393 RepID=UPI002AD418CD|nr:hypothetical protein [Nostoc sp. DedQUE08]MDZ8070037.1 hypothetical protein [Nostoc sp. DedQUE08]